MWQRLRDEHGLATSLTSFRRWVVGNVPEEARRSVVSVLRDDVPAGEEAQIDYGLLGTWTDPVGGKRRKVWAFVMVLACSRHMFVQPTMVMDQAAWTQAHVDAFAFFGGVPRRLVPDNLRTGVTRADLYDPKINRSYAELAEHYGVLVDPGRAAKPKDNAYAERWVRTLRNELTDRMLIFGQRHLRHVLLDYVRHYNHSRPHRARSLSPPRPPATIVDLAERRRIRRKPILGGLINE